MEPRPGFADAGSRDPVPGGSPFRGPGLLARVSPFGLLGIPGGQTLISVEAVERLTVMVAATGQHPPNANGDGGSRDFGPLRERARRDAITIEIEPATDGTRRAWSVPLRPSKRSGRAS